MNWPSTVVLIGAGNVAWHLGKRLQECGPLVVHVYARTASRAVELAKELNCQSSDLFKDIPPEADLYILAVNDAAIRPVAKELSSHISKQSLVLHTSGATPASVFSPQFKRYGVLYPLQTFSKKRTLDFSTVPLCICTNMEPDFESTERLAKRLSNHVYAVSDEQRLHLHLAAVFVNNFTNYLQYISQNLLEERELPTQLLQPLLLETVAKLGELPAKEAQTGPALRGDSTTLTRHLFQLSEHPHWQDIYRLISEGIEQDLRD